MIVLKVLVAIIVIEAIAIMVLGIARSAAEIKRLHKPYTHSNGVDKMFENVDKGFTIELSDMQTWDTENISTFHQDKPDGGLTAISEMINQRRKRNENDTGRRDQNARMLK